MAAAAETEASLQRRFHYISAKANKKATHTHSRIILYGHHEAAGISSRGYSGRPSATSTFLHMPDIFPVPAACASRIVLFAEGKAAR